MQMVWAIGPLDSNKEPAYHDLYPKANVIINFNSTEPVNDCVSFTMGEEPVPEVWDKSQIFDRAIRSFNAVLGPAGGKRGYQGITGSLNMNLCKISC